jgi:hypothetical protein
MTCVQILNRKLKIATDALANIQKAERDMGEDSNYKAWHIANVALKEITNGRR